MLKTVYYSLIYSHIQYCITTLKVASATALELLEKNAQTRHWDTVVCELIGTKLYFCIFEFCLG